MGLKARSEANRLLGYPADARLLILNADDFGMCHAVNEAVIGTLRAGTVRSTTLMVPCPWALQAMRFLSENPDIGFGVHLTAISDPLDYAWGPLMPAEKVPLLVNAAGHFHSFERMHELLDEINLRELDLEFRAQIEAVLAAGLHPTHLDWHALRIDERTVIQDLLFGLAREYRLALRVRGRSWIERVQALDLPAVEYDFLDSSMIDTVRKGEIYARLLTELPEGLSEWAVHPGLDTPELLAIEPDGNHARQADFDFFTSPETHDFIRGEGIILLDYKPLQAIWARG